MTKAACAVAFDYLNVKSIKLEVFKDNISAIKTYKRAGFKTVGETIIDNGQSMYLMKITK